MPQQKITFSDRLNHPSFTNFYEAIPVALKGLEDVSRGLAQNDTDKLIEGSLQISKAPFSFTYACGELFSKVTTVISKIIIKIKQTSFLFKTLAKIFLIAGLIELLFETAIESLQLKKTIKFSQKKLFSLAHKIKNPQEPLNFTTVTLIKELESLNQEYFQASEVKIRRLGPAFTKEKAEELIINNQKEKLAKTISPWAVNLLEKNLPKNIKDIKSNDLKIKQAALEETLKLIDILKTQSKKMFLIHSIGFTSIALTFSGLALGLAVMLNPFFLPLSLVFLPSLLFWTGFSSFIIRYCCVKGMTTNKGWHFSFSKIPPDFLKKFFSKQLSKPE